jgi:hypothetical protein
MFTEWAPARLPADAVVAPRPDLAPRDAVGAGR